MAKRLAAAVLILSACTVEASQNYYYDVLNRFSGLSETQSAPSVDLQYKLQSLYQSIGSSRGDKLTTLSNVLSSGSTEVSEVCLNQTQLFLRALGHKNTSWPKLMLDAMGKPPAGIAKGYMYWLGDFDQCLDVQATGADGSPAYRGKYCSVYRSLGYGQNFGVGVCVPDGCSASDVRALVSTLSQPFINGTDLLGDDFMVNCQEPIPLDSKATVAIIVCSIIIALVVTATAHESWKKFQRTTQLPDYEQIPELPEAKVSRKLSVTERTPLVKEQETKGERPSTLLASLMSFSLLSNLRKLLNVSGSGEGTLGALHGIRFLSITWVILGHTYGFQISVSANSADVLKWTKRFSFQAIDNAFFAVDSFFVLSGLLLVYLIMREKERKGKINWVMFYVHRFWRLTPAYMLVLMVDVCLWRYLGDGPLWPQNGFEMDECKYWWSNLLYINNFVHTDKMCFGWSWYLANDMQLYVISPLILIPWFFSEVLGLVLISAMVLIHVLTNAIITYYNHLGTGSIIDPNMGQFMNLLYFKPYTRLGPYAIGMLTGYLLHKYKGKLRLPKWFVIPMWCIAAVFTILALYGLTDTYRGYPLTPEVKALYNGFSRIIWSVGLAWVLYACSTGYGGFVNTLLSWKGFIPASRLSYCAYLVHPLIIYFYMYSQRVPITMTDTSMIYLFLGQLSISFGTAFLASLCFEAPMMGLEKALWRK